MPKLNDPGYFSADELEAVKQQRIVGTDARVSSAPRASRNRLGFWWAVTGLDYFMGYVDTMAKQTPADLQSYASKYIIGKPHVTGVLDLAEAIAGRSSSRRAIAARHGSASMICGISATALSRSSSRRSGARTDRHRDDHVRRQRPQGHSSTQHGERRRRRERLPARRNAAAVARDAGHRISAARVRRSAARSAFPATVRQALVKSGCSIDVAPSDDWTVFGFTCIRATLRFNVERAGGPPDANRRSTRAEVELVRARMLSGVRGEATTPGSAPQPPGRQSRVRRSTVRVLARRQRVVASVDHASASSEAIKKRRW